MAIIELLAGIVGSQTIALLLFIFMCVLPSSWATFHFTRKHYLGAPDAPIEDSYDFEELIPPIQDFDNSKRRCEYDVPIRGYSIETSICKESIKMIAHNGEERDLLSVEDPLLEKNKEDALRVADRVVAEKSTDSRLQNARDLINAGKLVQGEQLLQHIIEHEVHYRLNTEDHVELDDNQKQEYANDCYQFSLAFLYRGALSWMEDNTHVALQNYKDVVRLDEQNLEAWNRLSQIYEQIGNVDMVIESLGIADKIGDEKRAKKLQAVIKDNLELLYNDKEAAKNLLA